MLTTTDEHAIDARYRAFWDQFSHSTIVVGAPPSRRGRHERAAFVVRIIDGGLFRRLDRIRAAVAEFGGVVPVPDHCLHVPILTVGDIAPNNRRSGEVSPSQLEGITKKAHELLRDVDPTEVRIARVNVGHNEIFAELHPAESLVKLRDVLNHAIGGDADQSPFLPRLPLARIVAPVKAQSLRQALEWFRDRPIGGLDLHTVAMVRYDARVVHPALRRIAELHIS